jgi:hypothetical protein
MNQKKIKKIILLATLGVCMFSFMPAVVGKANNRPISAFIATNDDTGVAGWGDPETGLAVFPHGFIWHPQTISDCDVHGSVLVKDLKDGRISYKVNLHVKGALMWLFNASDYTLIFVGLMDYYFSTILIVYGDISDPVPNLLPIWFGDPPIGESPFQHITGSGTGEFIEVWPGFTPGDTAKVKVNQVGMAITEDHPQFDPESEYGLSMWPVEIVFFH